MATAVVLKNFRNVEVLKLEVRGTRYERRAMSDERRAKKEERGKRKEERGKRKEKTEKRKKFLYAQYLNTYKKLTIGKNQKVFILYPQPFFDFFYTS
ncbi:MAG: hypothetical protein Q8O62_10260 [Aequorivita sp.]|nr:hypothetical protein [Aequorivita sp.]